MTTIAIAGGTGRAGALLAGQLSQRFSVRQLGSGTDLLSLASAEAALAGAQVAVYLARASRPPSRLMQALPADLELLMADSFARAAALCGVRRLVLWKCGEQDERVAPMLAAGVPLTVVDSEEALLRVADDEAATETASSQVLAPARAAPSATSCSVQRLKLPKDWTAEQAARAYFEWAATHLPGVGCESTGAAWTLKVLGLPVLCLSLIQGRSTPDVALLAAGGGLLVGSTAVPGHFEFRVVPTAQGPRLFTALTGFTPALPWLVYRLTQAPVHGWVMKRFGRWLATR